MKQYYKNLGIAIAFCLTMSFSYATELAKKDTAVGEVKTIQYTVKAGDTAYDVAKKLLTPQQSKSLLKWVNVRGNTLTLKPNEQLKFEVQHGTLVAVSYGKANQLKRLAIGFSKPVSDVGTKASLKHSSVSAGDGSENRWLTVKEGDSVMRLADRAQLPSTVKASLLKHAAKLQSIKPKDSLLVTWNGKSGLKEVVLKRGSVITPIVSYKGSVAVSHNNAKVSRVTTSSDFGVVSSNSQDVKATKLSKKTGYRMISVKVRHNFVKDATAAGLPKNVVQAISDLYQRNQQSSKALSSGSHVDIVYRSDQKQFPVAYSKLTKGKQKYEAILYQTRNGSEYYDAEGRPYQQSFLRTPLGTHRLSSSFSLKRKHPVSGRVKPHYGVDFAAKPGTPVWASASGKVVYAGYQRGYGRVVKVQHSPSVTTLYAHLSKFDTHIKVGSLVKQKQVLGYVGSSGVATGPHLHYEYHINGQPRDPMTVALASGKRLRNYDRVTMLAQRKQWLAMADSSPAV